MGALSKVFVTKCWSEFDLKLSSSFSMFSSLNTLYIVGALVSDRFSVDVGDILHEEEDGSAHPKSSSWSDVGVDPLI